MNIEYYRNYIGIVEAGSFSEASRRLGTAQPALSNQVKALEERFQTRLIQRGSGTHRLALTKTGRILYESAKRMIAEEDAAIESIARHRTDAEEATPVVPKEPARKMPKPATLRIGTLPELLGEVPRTDRVEITVVPLQADALWNALANGQVDGVYAERSESVGAFECVATRQTAFVACYHPDVFFRGNRSETISLDELLKFPLCVLQRALSDFRAAFRKEGLVLMPRSVCSCVEDGMRFAAAKRGVAIVPAFAPGGEFDALRQKRIAGDALGVVTRALYVKKEQAKSDALAAWTEACMQISPPQGSGEKGENE